MLSLNKTNAMKRLKPVMQCFIAGALMVSLISYLGDTYKSLTKQPLNVSVSHTNARIHKPRDLTSYKGTHTKTPTVSEVAKNDPYVK